MEICTYFDETINAIKLGKQWILELGETKALMIDVYTDGPLGLGWYSYTLKMLDAE